MNAFPARTLLTSAALVVATCACSATPATRNECHVRRSECLAQCSSSSLDRSGSTGYGTPAWDTRSECEKRCQILCGDGPDPAPPPVLPEQPIVP